MRFRTFRDVSASVRSTDSFSRASAGNVELLGNLLGPVTVGQDLSYVHGLPSQTEKALKSESTTGHRVAYWVCESTELGPKWLERGQVVDEIWTASRFCVDVFTHFFNHPVKLVPHFTDQLGWKPRAEGVFKFLTSFDGHSRLWRKNPMDVIQAFKAAFGVSRDVQLTVKCRNVAPTMLTWLQSMAAGSNVLFVVKDYTSAQMVELLDASHCYVNLAFGEGFGLPVLDAMARGLAVITTNGTGMDDFVPPAMRVESELVDTTDDFFYGQWFSPDHDAAVSLMRKLSDWNNWEIARAICQTAAAKFTRVNTFNALRTALS